MSAHDMPRERLEVRCDEPGCTALVAGVRMSLREVRTMALERGWLHQSPPWREWCPEHWPANARSKARA